ncbi:SRPBCC family protein [Pedobacter sp. SYP-B3415]|uniref:SRPBCC family protein n=1 Tax=Pedobacter sp. SYP-B3415 TaxID=2496641 RepID=UPI00101CFDF8|nr:SRPBCC family protein [Pedobacter sp. SYP-B3415]
MIRITFRNMIDAEVQVCFDMARNIDLHLESMHDSHETAIRGKTSGLIALGETVTWRARHLGLWFEMTSKITAMQAPGYFRDEMQDGPFARFSHAHLFQAAGKKTLMTDIIEITAPLGFAGRLAERLFLAPYLTRLLKTRNTCISAAAESARH